MSQKGYYADTYKDKFDAQITGQTSNNQSVSFDTTFFYPGGGGQPYDLGSLVIDNSPEVYSVVEVYLGEDGQIWHKLDRPLASNNLQKIVHAKLDWERRYAHMRYHTALHVLNGVAYHTFGALVTGAQVYSDRARIDFTMEDLATDRIEILEQMTNEAIAKALQLNQREVDYKEAAQMPELIRTLNTMPPQFERVRIVEIEGLDRQFCGGTHLVNTQELKHLKIATTRSKGKQNKRIEIVLEY